MCGRSRSSSRLRASDLSCNDSQAEIGPCRWHVRIPPLPAVSFPKNPVPRTLISNRFCCATAVMDTSARMPHDHCCSFYRVLQFRARSPFDICDLMSATPGTHIWRYLRWLERFIAAMINTSSSVKPRVVIFHMTASRLIRSIAPVSEARAMPNFVAHASGGKVLGLAENRSALKMLKGSKLSVVLEAMLKR